MSRKIPDGARAEKATPNGEWPFQFCLFGAGYAAEGTVGGSAEPEITVGK